MTGEKARKLNLENLVTFLLVFTAITLAGLLAGIIHFDIMGLLAGLAFVSFLAFIGYLVDKSGLARRLGWDK